MKISEIAKRVDFASVLKRSDLVKPALDILELAIREGDIDRFLQHDGNLNKYSRTGMIGLLRLRIKNLTAHGREFYGFDEALAAVSRLDDTEQISWTGIQTSTQLLMLLFVESSCNVVGCMSLKSE